MKSFRLAYLSTRLGLAGLGLGAFMCLTLLADSLGRGAAALVPTAAAAAPDSKPGVDPLDGVLDYDALTRRSFGQPCPPRRPACVDHWVALTEAQRREVSIRFRPVLKQAAARGGLAAAKHDDIVIEGSSTTANYYDQIHRFLTDPAKGYPFLAQRLAKKAATL